MASPRKQNRSPKRTRPLRAKKTEAPAAPVNTARFAVIGDPIEHSLAPRLFGLLFQELGLAATYRAERVREGELPAFLKRVRAGEYQGLSIGLPHKITLPKLLDSLEPMATRAGSVNCIRAQGKKLTGHNTLLSGIARALHHHFGNYPTRKRVLILGAGGAARAAAVAMSTLSSAEVVIANRTLSRAREVVELIDHGRAVRLDDDLRNECIRADIIINATSVGLQRPNADPLPLSCPIRSGQTVVDLVYRPLRTALLRRAHESGAMAIDGLWVLIYQAMFQMALWAGGDADRESAERLYAKLAPDAA
jgi:shikimate dehydrogenase